MKKEIEHIELITRVLSGNCTASEKATLDQWIGMSVENQNSFLSYKSTWLLAGSAAPQSSFNVDKAWDKLNTTLSCVESEPLVNTPEKKPLYSIQPQFGFYLKRIAAVLVLAFGLFYLFNQKPQPELLTIASAKSVDVPAVLPDGSKIYLNHNTSVTYPEVFASGQRLVGFKGEGFFEIAHNPSVPMIIETGNLRVKVLGTTFDLVNYEESNEIVLYLQSGKVLFYSVDPLDGYVVEQLILTPGQMGVYNKVTGSLSKADFVSNNFLAWKSGQLEFVKTPLSDVFEALEKTYGIRVNSTTMHCDNRLLTATYSNETVESVFESIRVIFGINYSIDGEQVVLQ
ncbi:MAG: hypothetical protein CVT99_14700 [Bacteroidetes bacterium HGW-Bacteroidetes-16]|nr:MAG: hypothetical protein CVT99_14700 [Bacteroidetes bacterium HGW-Bacteroidetes-16]